MKKNKNFEAFLDWLFIPIKELEIYLRKIFFIKAFYENVFVFIYPILKYVIIDTYIFYIVFWVCPRLLLLSALFIDVFIFDQLHYKYQVILFGLLLFFNRCFKYSLKNIKEEKTLELKIFLSHVTTDYVFVIHPSEWPENYNLEDDDDDYIPTMCLLLDIYIKFYVESLVYKDIYRNIKDFTLTNYAYDYIWEKYVGEKRILYGSRSEIPKEYKNKFGDISPDNYFEARSFVYKKCDEFAHIKLNEIIKLSLLLEYINKTSNYDIKIKYIKILIYTIYLLCWLYVLIISLPNLHLYDLFFMLIKTWMEIKEPFSENSLF